MTKSDAVVDETNALEGYRWPAGDKLGAEVVRHQRALLKVREVVQVLGIGRSTVYELMDSGTLESVRIGKSRRVPTDALERFLADLARATNGP